LYKLPFTFIIVGFTSIVVTVISGISCLLLLGVAIGVIELEAITEESTKDDEDDDEKEAEERDGADELDKADEPTVVSEPTPTRGSLSKLRLIPPILLVEEVSKPGRPVSKRSVSDPSSAAVVSVVELAAVLELGISVTRPTFKEEPESVLAVVVTTVASLLAA